jgi:hypothetical protein
MPEATKVPTLLHLHIPKAGGTTLNHCIYAALLHGHEYREDEPLVFNGVYYYPFGFFRDETCALPESAARVLRRRDLRAVLGHFSYGIHRVLNRPCSYITMLREPVARVVSLLDHIRRFDEPGFEPSGRELHDRLLREDSSVEAFVRHAGLKEVDNDQTRRISGMDPPFGRCSRAMLQRARDNLARFAAVGTSERFDEALVLVHSMFHWDRAPSYLPELVSPTEKGCRELRPQDVAAIREFNELDLALHSFAGELLDERIARLGDGFLEDLHALERRNADVYAKYGHLV